MRFPTPIGKTEGGEKGSVVVSSSPSSFSSDKILVAQGVVHQGAMHGLISNGGKKSVGNFIIEFVNDGSQFTTIQIHQCALGITPKVQTWNRTKTVKQTVIKEKLIKPKAPLKQFVNEGTEEI